MREGFIGAQRFRNIFTVMLGLAFADLSLSLTPSRCIRRQDEEVQKESVSFWKLSSLVDFYFSFYLRNPSSQLPEQHLEGILQQGKDALGLYTYDFCRPILGAVCKKLRVFDRVAWRNSTCVYLTTMLLGWKSIL